MHEKTVGLVIKMREAIRHWREAKFPLANEGKDAVAASMAAASERTHGAITPERWRQIETGSGRDLTVLDLLQVTAALELHVSTLLEGI
jgi:hypothetical protein